MAGPQELSDLFDSLKAEVAKLEKQKADLELACNSLQGRKLFLENETKQLDEKNTALIEDSSAIYDGVKFKKKAAELRLTEAQAALTQTENDHRVKVTELDKQFEASTQKLGEINKEISERRQVLHDLNVQITTAKNDFKQLEASIAKHKNNIADIHAKAADVQLDANARMAGIEAEVAAAQKDLDTINNDVTAARDRLADTNQAVEAANGRLVEATKQHQDFVTYEKKAKIALKTKEASLIKQEEDLGVRIVTSRRRNGILDNIE